jgi:biopolymer transport protein ExbD/biopolymer transport protein TolR
MASPAPEINVTPLVDVVLVLLIILMVIAPQLEGGVRVDLPGMSNPDPKAKGVEPLTLTVAADGALYVDKSPTTLDALDALFAEVRAATPDRRLMVRGDQALSWGPLRDLFARGQKAGFPGVSLVVGDRQARSPGGADEEAQ